MRGEATRIRLVLLDRDGTLNVDTHYLSEPDQVHLLPGVVEGLIRMRELGLKLAVVSNQSGIARGYYTREAVEGVNARLVELLRAAGAGVDSVHYCPHQLSDECGCRKPKTGLLEEAARVNDVPLASAVMIGDNYSDLEAAVNAGIPSILVRTGYGARVEVEPAAATAAAIVDSLADAAEVIARRLQKV